MINALEARIRLLILLLIASSDERLRLRSRLVASGVWALIGAITTRGFTLAATMIAARVLGPTSFGELGMIQSTVALSCVAAGLGTGLTATKFVAEFKTRDADQAGRFVALSMAITLAASLVISALFFLAAPWVSANLITAPELSTQLRIASPLIVFTAVDSVQTGILSGLEAFKGIAKTSFLRGVVTFMTLTTGAWFGALPGALLGLTAGQAAGVLFYQRLLQTECRKSSIRVTYRELGSVYQTYWRFTLPAFLASTVTQPAMWLCNTLLVNQPGGYAELGLFTAADKWRTLIVFVPSTIAATALPVLASLYGARDSERYAQVFKANVATGLALAGTLALVAAALAHQIISLYGRDYVGGLSTLLILIATAIPTVLNSVLGQVVVTSDAIWWRFAFDVVLASLLLVSGWYLIPLFGAQGMAIAYLVAYGLTSVGLFFAARRRIGALNANYGNRRHAFDR